MNASTVTLKSYSASTPKAEVTREFSHPSNENEENREGVGEEGSEAKTERERPEMERFETAREGF